MAATIVSTPATGSSDWTGWITQQGLTDRGFMQVSLTNFATTAASSIAAGSIMELAGSIYSCTETAISLAAGTASADVAVYYVAIPSAGGTTCTFTMDSVAPTWVDAKQGFYASAASTSRYLGGTYIGITAATYYTKFIYTPDMVFGYLLPSGKTRPLLKKVIEIGDWNMDGTALTVITHGFPNHTKIRRIDVLIRHDNDTSLYDLESMVDNENTTVMSGGVRIIGVSVLHLVRTINQLFDNTSFDSTSYNRGWVTIEYEA